MNLEEMGTLSPQYAGTSVLGTSVQSCAKPRVCRVSALPPAPICGIFVVYLFSTISFAWPSGKGKAIEVENRPEVVRGLETGGFSYQGTNREDLGAGEVMELFSVF